MKGHRAKLSGAEWDAFSRRSRGIIGWGRGSLRKIKRAFSKRVRKAGRLSLD